MLTLETQLAISVLRCIASGCKSTPTVRMFSANIVSELLDKLVTGKIIQPLPDKKRGEISLLDILEATGEHLNCNHPATEEFYSRYSNAAQKLGVVNQMTRLYLENIKLNDL